MEGTELFWDIGDDLMVQDPRVVEGRIMSSRCLRVEDEFLAMCDRRREGLVVKLSKPRVDELIAKGVGEPFAPAGRVFKEWVLIPDSDRQIWTSLLHEGIEFAAPVRGVDGG